MASTVDGFTTVATLNDGTEVLTPRRVPPPLPPMPRRGVAVRRPRKPCSECLGVGNVMGIECERCDGSCVEPEAVATFEVAP